MAKLTQRKCVRFVLFGSDRIRKCTTRKCRNTLDVSNLRRITSPMHTSKLLTFHTVVTRYTAPDDTRGSSDRPSQSANSSHVWFSEDWSSTEAALPLGLIHEHHFDSLLKIETRT